MKVLALYSIKGGVGKTAGAVNLAYEFSQSGAKTLLIDLDPQAAASFYLDRNPKKRFESKALTSAKSLLTPSLRKTSYQNLHILPGDLENRNLDLLLNEKGKPQTGLEKALKEFRKSYEYIVLDCPPGLTLLSENILLAADFLLCPVIPSPLSLRTMDSLQSFHKSQKNRRTKIYCYFSMVEKRKKIHQESMESLRSTKTRLLETLIPRSAEVEKMGAHQAPLGVFGGKRVPAVAFRNLALEIKRIMKK